MSELWLKYTNSYGDSERISIAREIFTVGRHPENDLCIPDNRLSREHIRIEQYNESFYVSDSGSSNGTTLNGAPLTTAVILRDGDALNLAGAIDIRIEVKANNQKNDFSAANDVYTANQTANNYAPAVETPAANVATQSNSAPAAASSTSAIPTAFFWIAPIFGLVVLILVGGFFFLFGGNKKNSVVPIEDTEPIVSRTRTPKTDEDETPTPRKTETPGNSGSANSSGSDSNLNLPSAPKTSADVDKVEQNASKFLRRIAQNDPRAFLTTKQAETVNAKISAFKNSSALAENLKAVQKNASQFETLASSKNLKAQFLATAALAKIGNNRGDPLAVANTILPILSDLKITLDNKLADDNLMIIAAFERGAAGKPRSLQSTLEALSKTTQNVSPREIRTIWFLREKDKITEAEFNFALQFLAIGAITQNPKDFNVNAEAITFN